MSDIGSTYLEDPRFNGRQGFGASLADYVDNLAHRRGEVHGLGTAGQRGRVAVLERIADHFSELDEIRDRRLMVLGAVNAAFVDLRRAQIRFEHGEVGPDEIGVTADRFDKPSPLQSWLLAVVGDPTHPAPIPDKTVDDLAAAGVRDLVERVRQVTSNARDRNKELTDEVESLATQLEQARIEASEIDGLRAANEELTRQLAAKETLVEEQQSVIGELEPTKPPRRRAIEPGIYRAASGGLEVLKPAGGYVKADSLGAARLLHDELRANDDAPEDPAVALEAALDAREKELGRELTEEEIDAFTAETSTSMPSGGEED